MLHHHVTSLCAARALARPIACALLMSAAHAQVCNDVAAAEFLGGQTAGLRGVPVLGYVGSPIVGRPFALRVTNGRPSSLAVIAVSVAHAPLTLGALGATVHPAEPFSALLIVSTDADGATPAPVSPPVIGPSSCGLEFYTQAVVVDADATGGLAFSAGLRFVVGQPKVDLNRLFEPELGLSGPIAVTSADFNRDGFADLAIADAHLDEVAVLLGRGDGTFDDRVGFAVGDFPHAIVAADFDGDGRVDLATANYQDASLSILIGDGLGSFAPATHHQLAAPGRDIDAGDIDGDGAIDLVVGMYDFGVHVNSGVSVFQGDGAGGFIFYWTLPTVDLVFRVAVGDVNADGALDIVALTAGIVRVYPGNGDMSFGAWTDHAAGSAPLGLDIADLDGDGRSDIVVCNQGSSSVSTLIALAGGGFTTHAAAASIISAPRDVVVADVSGDGLPDAVTANSNSTFAVALGSGSGDFAVVDNYDAGLQPSRLVLVDLDGDGMRDVVVVNFGSNDLTVVLNQLVD